MGGQGLEKMLRNESARGDMEGKSICCANREFECLCYG